MPGHRQIIEQAAAFTLDLPSGIMAMGFAFMGD
jgi:hypothetical protein